ncbi:unnamed protein product [Arabis nemorensis]|uniref:Uncharacterized protein n=1 Tax=Arabis nemorensis TaxID=586526 RepID=A0A565CDP3_9BRAS|nr:unnamed protein product [Arabis nemorensis]
MMGRTFSYCLSSSFASIRSGWREADGEYGIPASLCYCGGRVVVQTSRTDLYRGRRFFTCKNSEVTIRIVRLVEYEATLKELELLAKQGVNE